MLDHSTGTLSENDLKVVADIVAKDPEFAADVAEIIAEKLDEKFGWRQGDMRADIKELKGQFKELDQKFDHIQNGFDNLEGNLKTFHERLDVEARKIEKRVVRAIDERFSELRDDLRRRPA